MFSVSVEVSGVTRSETQHYSSAEWGTIDVSLWMCSEHASGMDKDRTIQPENTLSGQRRNVWAGVYTVTESEYQVDCWQELLRLYCTTDLSHSIPVLSTNRAITVTECMIIQHMSRRMNERQRERERVRKDRRWMKMTNSRYLKKGQCT